MIRHRKEVDATKLQKIVQTVFIKEKKEGRKRAIQNLEAFLKRFQNTVKLISLIFYIARLFYYIKEISKILTP